MSAIGVAAIVGFCFLVSTNRRAIDWRLVLWGLGLQLIIGLLILKTYPEAIFYAAQSFFNGVSTYAAEGSKFLFGPAGERKDLVIVTMGSVIIFVSSMMAVLNYLRVLPAIIYCLARVMQFTMRTSGAETLAAAMFTMMGIEVVTGLKTIISRLTHSELFSVMTCFLATIAGSVMAVYVSVFGANPGHILAASLMNAPAALALSKMMVPETEEPETRGRVDWTLIQPGDRGLVEAAANGALDGMKLALAIGAILLAFVAIIHMLNSGLGLVGTSFEAIGGYLFAPVAFLLGVPWEDCAKAGNLLAVKTFFNEWLAYGRMHDMVLAGQLAPRSVSVLTYAFCSFANFGSLGILIGGITALAPERSHEVSSSGLRAMLAGLLAGFLTAAVAGVLLEG